jgi:dihydrofolate reductase
MTRVIFNTAVSFDGFIADTHNSLGWLFAVDPDDQPDNADFMDHIGVLVEGSTTYRWVLDEADLIEQPQRWQEYYGDRPTFVFTSRRHPTPVGADVRFVRGRVADVLPDILEAAGDKDVWVTGGGDLAGQFLDADALDRIELTIAPVALGAGAALLPRRVESDRLRLESAERYGQFARIVYSVVHELRGR